MLGLQCAYGLCLEYAYADTVRIDGTMSWTLSHDTEPDSRVQVAKRVFARDFQWARLSLTIFRMYLDESVVTLPREKTVNLEAAWVCIAQETPTTSWKN